MVKLSSSCNLSLFLLVVAGCFLNSATGFTSSHARRRKLLFAIASDKEGDASAGAGSWRSKAKEFLNSNNGDDVEKKLNIAFVTGNAMKQREINMILSNQNATSSGGGESFVNLRILDVDLPEIQEINTEAVAKNKAIQGAQLAGGACVVEDTSLGKFLSLATNLTIIIFGNLTSQIRTRIPCTRRNARPIHKMVPRQTWI